MHNDLILSRQILEAWADWLTRAGGYPHRSSIDQFRDGWGGGGHPFQSTVPRDVDPGRTVARASRAMQHLRDLDGDKYRLLDAFYRLRQSASVIAREREWTVEICRQRIRLAERAFLDLHDMIALADHDVSR